MHGEGTISIATQL